MVQEQSSSHHPQHHHHHHHPQLPKYGGGGGGGGSVAATGVARASKKNKPKKIPQRGLGVAQLEKLRIEEQKKMDGGGASGSTAPLPLPPPHSHTLGAAAAAAGLGHLLPLHPAPPQLPLSALARPAADGGVHCGFTSVMWNPVDAMKHPYKRSLCAQPPFPMVSTGLSLTASSSHPTEPPSNQMYSSSGSRSSAAAPAPATAEEDREMAGVDRSWPFMFEGMSAATFRTTSKTSPVQVVPFAARAAREAGLRDVCPDLSRYEFRATNYYSTNTNYSDWAPADLGHCKSSSKEKSCGGEPGFLALSAQAPPHMKQPHVLPPVQHLPEHSDFGAMAPQHGSIQASQQQQQQPFYSFLPVGPVRCERALSECKADAADGVDLDLKLWKS
ncbi:hypothetical protein ACP4OV_031364 [Aristida adscensionis]